MHQNPLPYSSTMINNNSNNISLQFPEHEHLNCPRCDSNNTKFCYYNNYNLSQPRHYCKNCRRYWTKGGTLRKIPIGGGTRKPNKRSSPNKRPAAAAHDDSVSDSKSTLLLPPDGSEKKDLDKSGLFQLNFLSMNNNNNNNNHKDGDGDGESSGDVWPNLSIFTSGSNLR